MELPFNTNQPAEQQPVTVLGHTFANDDERRTFFRNELRKHLPELKKIEGFPIGDDEDIINLSDPPYYTACPNPWLNDFIALWEAEKAELEAQGKRVSEFEVEAPYASDVSEGKNNPIYNAHSYHTKVPHPAIMRYILHYTQPGDIVFDGFAGTGMTGVAAGMCGNPDAETKQKIEAEFKEAGLSQPIWGQRHAICGDIAPYAFHISHILNGTFNLGQFKTKYLEILNEVQNQYGWIFQTKINNKKADIIYSVLSERVLCNNCNKDFSYWKSAVNPDLNIVLIDYPCPYCGTLNSNKTSENYFITEFDKTVNKSRLIRPLEYVFISYKIGKERGFKFELDESDYSRIKRVNDLYATMAFKKRLFLNQGQEWGDTWRKGYHKGIEYVHDFYTKSNLIIINEIHNRILEVNDNQLKSLLLFWFTASQSRLHKMNRYSPQHSRHVGPMANTYYISPLPTEISPFYFFKEKANDLLKVEKLRNKNVSYVCSATDVKFNDDSIDYIFSDPPFGSNIMYSELNFIYEYWLNVFTEKKEEAIESKYQNKTTFVYQEIIYRAFSEYYRILKPGKWLTIEFSNTSATIWNTIQNALQRVGFIISNVSAINKGRGGMQAIIGPTAVNQDLIISCYKPSSEFDTKFQQSQHTEVGIWDFVAEHLHHLPVHVVKENATTAVIERSPKILFDRLIAFYVQRNLPVPIDAGLFQKGLRERFIERDGMYFTAEQAHQYDSKKAEVPRFVQLSLLVGSEQEGVLWLRRELENPQTYQELQPKWMQALAGARKGDIIPELRDMLEDNFLQNEAGAWYIPDMENEIDLEKVRTRRLLKQFDAYREQASKPKGKIKEARVEALRAGFKQCYKDKDFKTIVTIGDCIPNNLLMEDEVLLQYYDIAISRV